jgi:hypothetical protein
MVQLSDIDKSQLRRRYERLDARHARGLPTDDARLRRFTSEEIRRIFEQNTYDPQRWPTLTDLNDHLRNIATLRSMGYNAPI